jgi:hypothetical protein
MSGLLSTMPPSLEERRSEPRARLSLVRGPSVAFRPPNSPTATCWLDGDVLADVLRAATATHMAKDFSRLTPLPPPLPSSLTALLRLSPMAGRLNRAVGRHRGVAALYAKARIVLYGRKL